MSEIKLVKQDSLHLRDHVGSIDYNSTFEFSLDLSNIYLISILNAYNECALFFVSTGTNRDVASVTQLVGSSYFTLSPITKVKFRVSSANASGYIYAFKMT